MYKLLTTFFIFCFLTICNLSYAQATVEQRLERIQTLLDNGTITQAQADAAIARTQEATSNTTIDKAKTIKFKPDFAKAKAIMAERRNSNPNKFKVDPSNFEVDGKKINRNINWRTGPRPPKFVKPN